MNQLDKVIEQIGEDALRKSMGDIGIGNCDVHGRYAYDMVSTGGNVASCPICPPANGVTATQVEHYIDMQPVPGTNPGQKVNPYGI